MPFRKAHSKADNQSKSNSQLWKGKGKAAPMEGPRHPDITQIHGILWEPLRNIVHLWLTHGSYKQGFSWKSLSCQSLCGKCLKWCQVMNTTEKHQCVGYLHGIIHLLLQFKNKIIILIIIITAQIFHLILQAFLLKHYTIITFSSVVCACVQIMLKTLVTTYTLQISKKVFGDDLNSTLSLSVAGAQIRHE